MSKLESFIEVGKVKVTYASFFLFAGVNQSRWSTLKSAELGESKLSTQRLDE
jgi:hypothetical protein